MKVPKPIIHAGDHRPRGWNGADDPGGADPIAWLTRNRIVHGRIYDDATTLWAGSGDWSANWTSDGIEITISPGFSEGYDAVACPNDNEDFTYLSPPVLQPTAVSGLSMSGFVLTNQIDLTMFRIVFWDLDGNPMQNRCGFDFHAIGT